MLAARARGIGTAWTTLHLMHEKEIAELIGIPYDEFMQIALIPIAYTKGTSFKPAYRPDVEEIMHVDEWKLFFKENGYTGDYFWFTP